MPNPIAGFLDHHPTIKAFLSKVMKDNIGMLASVVSWTLLTSIVPIVVGLLAITGFVLRDPATRDQVVSHVSAALQNVLTRKEIEDLVNTVIQNNTTLTVIGLIGVFWGGSNVGGAISTVFQPIFQVRGRNFVIEKLIDIGMIFVFAFLLMVIITSTTAIAVLGRLISHAGPGAGTIIVANLVSLGAAFLLFAIIYIVFPNTDPRFKLRNVWPGAAIASVLFQILTYMFPIYASHAHFQKYGAVLFSILLLTAWIYFFSVIMLIGAEFVAFAALREAKAEGHEIGPQPDGTVPQRMDAEQNPAASS